MNKVIDIQKDQLSKLNFLKIRKKQKPKQSEQIHRLKAAIIKESGSEPKPRITINTMRGLFRFSAPVLMIGNDFVVLKGNTYVPLKCIVEVDL